MPVKIKYILAVLFFAGFACSVQAQQKKRVLIKKADLLVSEEWNDTTVNVLKGNVIFEHDGALMYCDSAYMYEKQNSFDAFGKVHINVNDSLNIYGDLLYYDGNTRLAELHYDVRLVDKTTTLYTQHLYYDRNLKRAHYPDSGRIVDGDNRLTSRNGYYFTEPRLFEFRNNVVLVNPDYTLVTDTLDYFSGTKVAFIKGPTTITGNERFVYAEDGWYDTRHEIVSLKHKVFIRNKDRTLSADSVYYRDKPAFGQAFRNVVAQDTTRKIIMTGEFSEYSDTLGYVYFTGMARALLYDKTDTLFLHADTLRLTFDTAREARYFYAYNKAKFYRNDLQGMSDSMVYYYPDSTLALYKLPVLWSDSSQMTADSIRMWIANQQADSMYMYGSAFIAQQDGSETFNQMRGRNMQAYFRDGNLRKVTITGNAESVYYIREEDGSLTGINFTVASNMYMLLENSKVTDIIYLVNPEGGTYPDAKFPADKRKLKGFEWFGNRRPLHRDDIFRW